MPTLDPKTTNEAMNQAMRQAIHGPRAERAQRFHDRRVAAVEEKLRRAYLGSDPTATEEQFREALPGLREELRRRAVVDGGAS